MILNGDLWNELYVNTYKAKYIFFYKEKDEDNISLYFKDLKINNIFLIQANNIFKCLFGQKSKLAKPHNINLEYNF